MIRFVLIGDQITDDEKEFAFFDTCTSKFIDFGNGEQVFTSIDDFKNFDKHPLYRRCYDLIPKLL